MTNTKKIYTLLIDDNGARILNREYTLEEMMYHQDIIDEYIDELSYDKIASYFEWFSMLISDIEINKIDSLKKYVSLNPKYFK